MTPEELDEIKRRAELYVRREGWLNDAELWYRSDIPRLVSALEEAWAEIERLKGATEK